MALIKCIECGKELSDKAELCPNCGCPANLSKNHDFLTSNYVDNGDNLVIEDVSTLDLNDSNKDMKDQQLHIDRKKFKWYYFVIFPFIPYYLIWKKTSMSIRDKFIVTILYSFILIILVSASDSGNAITTMNTFQIETNKQTIFTDEQVKLNIITSPELENYDGIDCFANNKRIELEDLVFSLEDEGEYSFYCSYKNNESNQLSFQVKENIGNIDKIVDLYLPGDFNSVPSIIHN